jgi:hypothetical protein
MVVVFFLSPTVSGGGGEKVEKLLWFLEEREIMN